MVNKVILVGNVGQEPEVKTLESGQQVATFSVATSENYKDKDGTKQTKTEWHNIVIWGKLAGIVESYVHKGDKLFLEGKITNRTWEKDNVKHNRTEILVSNMTMLGSKSEGGSQQETPEQIGNDNLPF